MKHRMLEDKVAAKRQTPCPVRQTVQRRFLDCDHRALFLRFKSICPIQPAHLEVNR